MSLSLEILGMRQIGVERIRHSVQPRTTSESSGRIAENRPTTRLLSFPKVAICDRLREQSRPDYFSVTAFRSAKRSTLKPRSIGLRHCHESRLAHHFQSLRRCYLSAPAARRPRTTRYSMLAATALATSSWERSRTRDGKASSPSPGTPDHFRTPRPTRRSPDAGRHE